MTIPQTIEPYNDRPFAVGTIVGRRTWFVDDYGRLRGVHQRRLWRPGVNKAECLCPAAVQAEAPLGGPGRIGHRCGFYAYTNGPLEFRYSPLTPPTAAASPFAALLGTAGPSVPNLGGIVEGWGSVTVGSRGFQASRAKVVAFVGSSLPADDHRWPAIMRNYPDVPIFPKWKRALAEFPLTNPLLEPIDDEHFWDDEPLPADQSIAQGSWQARAATAFSGGHIHAIPIDPHRWLAAAAVDDSGSDGDDCSDGGGI